MARRPASGVRRSWLTQATSSRRLASRFCSRARAWASRSWAVSRPSDSPVSSAGSGPVGAMYTPLSPVFSTDSSRDRLARVSRRPTIRATTNPARLAMPSISIMSVWYSVPPSISQLQPATPASAVTTETAEIRVSCSPIGRRDSRCSTISPAITVTTAIPPVTMDTFSGACQNPSPGKLPASTPVVICADVAI